MQGGEKPDPKTTGQKMEIFTCIIKALYKLIQKASFSSCVILDGSSLANCSTRNLIEGKLRSQRHLEPLLKKFAS